MAPSDDLKAHAASSLDFYALLDIPSTSAEAEIRRAYRKTALKYHPDKLAKPTPADLDKFHLLQIAYDVLSTPEVRQLYDNAREARERKRRQAEMMDATKRKMKEDLEAREKAGDVAHRGLKRPWVAAGVASTDAEERLEREVQRIAEDGRRKRREAEERLMKEAKQQEDAQKEQHATKVGERFNQRVDRSTEGGANVPELDRAVKVRWVREGRGLALNQSNLITLFAPFGKVENVFMLKDKRQRMGDSREKKTVATGVVVFSSVVGAHAAVLDGERKRKAGEENWAPIDSIFWASGAGPDLGLNDSTSADGTGHHPCSGNKSSSHSPSSFQHPSTSPPTAARPGSRMSHGDNGIRNPHCDFPSSSTKPSRTAPSFASFSNRGNPLSSSGDNSTTTRLGSASLEEVTLMRLKTAQREKERRALEEQICREEEEADAATKAEAAASSAIDR
jgi:DnaJ homolog subfamily C member 17